MDDVSDDWSGKFSYWDGKGIVVVSDRDVNVTNFGKLSGGYVLVGSDGELNIVNDGDVNRIEKSNVSNVYVSKSGQVLYLYDGDLYRVKKGDTNSERIARDVDDFRLYKGNKRLNDSICEPFKPRTKSFVARVSPFDVSSLYDEFETFVNEGA